MAGLLLLDETGPIFDDKTHNYHWLWTALIGKSIPGTDDEIQIVALVVVSFISNLSSELELFDWKLSHRTGRSDSQAMNTSLQKAQEMYKTMFGSASHSNHGRLAEVILNHIHKIRTLSGYGSK